ncbi:MAG: translocation/assembly module TamB domain-containing protein [Casimicrobiaceae bacterium]
MTNKAPEGTPSAAVPPRRRRWWRWVVWPVAGLIVALALGYVALGTQAALDYVLQRAIADADDHLTIEGAEGSLLSTIRVARLAWQGDDVDLEARGIALTWSPFDLVSRRLIIQGLGAQSLALHFKGTRNAATGLPANLGLPLEVDVKNIGVQRLDWKTGEGSGFVTGVTFGYSGGAKTHAVHALRFVTENGTLSGDAELGATTPFALRGGLAFDGDGAYKGGRAKLGVAGNLERIAIDGDGSFRNAKIAAKAVLTPFAPALLVSADVTANNVDLAQFAAAMPATALTLTLSARPVAGGFAGTLSAQNPAAGPIDADRVPVTALTSQFAWDGKVLTLTNLDARMAGNGRATGTVAVPIDGGPVQLQLALANVDLARIQSSLIATHMSGTVTAAVAQQKQIVSADLRQSDMALAFAATIAGKHIDIERLRAQAGGGEIAGNGSFDLDGTRPFTFTARATRFNPERFVDMPAALLDGTVTARGTLKPAWDVTADVALAAGSRFAGLAVAGTGRAHATPGSAKDIAVDLHLGTAKVVLTGAFGTAADTLAYAVDVPRLQDFRALATRYVKAALPEPIAGALTARGTVTGEPRSLGFAVTAHGEALQWGPSVRVATVDGTASAAPSAGRAGPIALEARRITLAVTATGVSIAQGAPATMQANVTGSLAKHAATFEAKGGDFDLSAAMTGGLVETKRADGARENTWVGTLDTLANRGAYAVRLDAPAALELARDRVHIGATRVAVAEGRADLAEFTLDAGRINTRGSFTGIPVAALARLSRTTLPFPSTLVVGGDWSFAATPRLSGALNVHRESGDWFATESVTLDPADLALGIAVFEVSVRAADDAFTGSARFRSARAGSADVTATLAAGSVPGQISTTAPITAKVTADLASLKPLQPWLGTIAVMDGRAHADIAARGTLAQPVFDGTLAGDALRFDLPQYGVHLKDGRLRARLAERTLFLDEFSFVGGSGKFVAKGTLARATDDNSTAVGAAHVEWQADNFTIVNRPDLHLVGDGKGTLALEGKKIALAGSLNFDEGSIEYTPTKVGTLSDDVVIKGEPRKVTAETGVRDLPLSLDLEVTLGRNFRFTGEGLATRLAGRVRVTTTASGALNAKGTIRAVAGTYDVFGQRLVIDRGQLLFDGPADNPALDVVALRKNLAVEAGVELTGTVKVPRVRLVSNPPVPDGEKLSWLLTGQGLDRANRADLAALSAASASLLGQGKKPITTQIANTVGLDDISVRETASATTAGTSGQVVAFGKRISDRLTLVYEQGLTVATNALRIEYALSRTLTLRAEAGTVSSLGLYFRRTYD